MILSRFATRAADPDRGEDFDGNISGQKNGWDSFVWVRAWRS